MSDTLKTNLETERAELETRQAKLATLETGKTDLETALTEARAKLEAIRDKPLDALEVRSRISTAETMLKEQNTAIQTARDAVQIAQKALRKLEIVLEAKAALEQIEPASNDVRALMGEVTALLEPFHERFREAFTRWHGARKEFVQLAREYTHGPQDPNKSIMLNDHLDSSPIEDELRAQGVTEDAFELVRAGSDWNLAGTALWATSFPGWLMTNDLAATVARSSIKLPLPSLNLDSIRHVERTISNDPFHVEAFK
jgi:hypothetical protein